MSSEEPEPPQEERKIGGRVTRVVLAAPSEAKPKWFDKVDGKVLNAMTDKEKKRQEVIFELITTEKDYVRDLDIIITVCRPSPFSTWPHTSLFPSFLPHVQFQVFLEPIRKKKIVNAKDVAILFSNVEQLVPVNMVRP